MVIILVLISQLAPAATKDAETGKSAYFGDLHVHTRYSYDAFTFRTYSSPDDAYRFAKGEPLMHPAGFELQLEQPLDFYAVTDHAEFLGMWWAIKTDPNHPLRDDPQSLKIADTGRGDVFDYPPEKERQEDVQTTWDDIQQAAGRHYDPGHFTTFIGFEFTTPGIHRNVIYRGTNVAPRPLSRHDSRNPEDLWNWMDKHRALGAEAMSIPHNMNLSGGRMFENTRFDGSPMDEAYAMQRMRNEPLVEITQVKGTSEAHPFLSTTDEWADFEIAPYKLGGYAKSQPQGSYVRQAWLDGLEMAGDGYNPYRFGVIGSSDTHNSGQRYEESNYVGKVGAMSVDPVGRGSVAVKSDQGIGYHETPMRYFGASGLAGIWARENTREALYDALRRKETFGTSGPRIKVRMLAGYDIEAAEGGVDATGAIPQGGDMVVQGTTSPQFYAWAMAGPRSAKLQRLQIIKGWADSAGDTHERVFDVACSDGLAVDPRTQRCPWNGAWANTQDCSVRANVGAPELKALWSDPEFNPDQRAFYYVRVLENPTCRWSTWDAIRAGTPPRPDLPAFIQERAWTSPIWLHPQS